MTAMLLGFNLLLWTTHVTDEHFPLFGELKKTGYQPASAKLYSRYPQDTVSVRLTKW